MELRTYTGLWSVEKKLYKFYDIDLPFPISVKQIGIFAASAIPWTILMSILHVPFESPWHLVWLAPPVLFMIYASRPIAEGKNLTDFILSQIKFLLAPKTHLGLRPQPRNMNKRIPLEGKAWTRIIEK